MRKRPADKQHTITNKLTFDHTGTMDASNREFVVPAESNGKSLAELSLPEGALVMLIRRESEFLIPRGSTMLQTGDSMMVVGSDKVLEMTELQLATGGTERQA